MADSYSRDSAAETSKQGASSSDSDAEAEIAEFLKQQQAELSRLDAIADKPVQVRSWKFVGLERTRESVFQKEMEHLTEIRTFAELRDFMNDLYISLENLNIFNAINIRATEPPEGVPHLELCDIVIRVVEKNRLAVNVGGFVQGSLGSLESKLVFTNILGLAEHIQVSGELGKEPSSLQDLLSTQQLVSELALRISRARINALPVNADLTLHTFTRDNEKWSSFKETLRGGILSFQNEDGSQTVNYELGWRHQTDPSRRASPAIQQQLGHSLKSAVSYMWRHNTFDNPFFPTSGYGIRSLTELSGLWADPKALRFGRQEVNAQVVGRLTGDVVVALHGGAGLLLPWGPGVWERPTPVSERYSSGGTSANMRGFYFKGLGQTDLRRRTQDLQNGGEHDQEQPRRTFDYLGGDLYCSLLTALRFRLQWIPPLHQAGIYGQAFANCGNNILLSGQHKEPKQLLKDFKSSFRWSVGAGLVWPLSMGSFELSYVRILKSQNHDEFKNGIHFGCSADLF